MTFYICLESPVSLGMFISVSQVYSWVLHKASKGFFEVPWVFHKISKGFLGALWSSQQLPEAQQGPKEFQGAP